MRLDLTQQLSNLKQRPRTVVATPVQSLLERAVIVLIRREPVYGLLLAKIEDYPDYQLNGPVGLGWRSRRLCLLYNPWRLIAQMESGPDLLATLIHVALHVIWLHPVIYSRSTWLTKLATDVEVNQYVPRLPPRSVTLAWLNHHFGFHLPRRAGSRFYLRRIRQVCRKHRGITNRLRSAVRRRSLESDSHRGWQVNSGLTRGEEVRLLKRLVKRSWHQAGAKGRGNLPGHVKSRLIRMLPHPYVKWQRYVRLGLGRTPFGIQATRARFNRRQAYRMDLPGSITNEVQSVSIFVDNSGSMGNAELSYLLAQIGSFLRRFPVQVTVYSFDTQIHRQAVYSARNYHQVRFKRFGGGGTRFQSIFDFCGCRLVWFASQLIMVLTDGQGERQLNYHGIGNVLWLLTVPRAKFSVRNVRGHVVSLVNDPNFVNRFD